MSGDADIDRSYALPSAESAAQPVGQRLALDQLHDEDGHAAIGLLEAVEGGDTGVVERGEDAAFLPQAHKAFGLAASSSGSVWRATSR